MTKASAIIVLDDQTKTIYAIELHIECPFKRFEVLRLDGFNTYGDIPELIRSVVIHAAEVENLAIRIVPTATGDQYDISIIDISNPHRIHQYII